MATNEPTKTVSPLSFTFSMNTLKKYIGNVDATKEDRDSFGVEGFVFSF